MKKNVLKKVLALVFVLALAVSCLAGCEKSGNGGGGSSQASNGTILWLSNLSSGPQYEAQKAYAEYLCDQMGYNFKVVLGDSMNDPDGNLTIVKNNMTSDVVGLILSQDGGVANIMDEYPDLWVVGHNSDFNSIYSDIPQVATSAAAKDNEKWLGTLADGHIDGNDTAQQMFDYIQSQGWKSVGIVSFPGFAYPNLEVAKAKLTELCEAAGITVPGGAVEIMFQPLEESYFQEAGRDNLDGIVALCAGTSFVYPTLLQAKGDGLCAAGTKLVTSGFDSDPSLIADIGENGTIAYLTISPNEDIAYGLTLLDKAIKGELYSDFKSERIDSAEYVIDSADDVTKVMEKTMMGTGNPEDAQVSFEDIQAVTSFADLQALFLSISVDGIK